MAHMHRRGFVLALAASFGLGSCAYRAPYAPPGYGPPPHAPAHGYRHKYQPDLILVYDTWLGLYVVEGWPGYYYYRERFFRLHSDGWHWSPHVRGTWQPTPNRGLPPGLAKKRR